MNLIFLIQQIYHHSSKNNQKKISNLLDSERERERKKIERVRKRRDIKRENKKKKEIER